MPSVHVCRYRSPSAMTLVSTITAPPHRSQRAWHNMTGCLSSLHLWNGMDSSPPPLQPCYLPLLSLCRCRSAGYTHYQRSPPLLSPHWAGLFEAVWRRSTRVWRPQCPPGLTIVTRYLLIVHVEVDQLVVLIGGGVGHSCPQLWQASFEAARRGPTRVWRPQCPLGLMVVGKNPPVELQP